MSSSWILLIAALIAASGLALVVARLLTLRAGLREASAQYPRIDPSELGLSPTGPTVVHFSAPWCGPCPSVRRVVEQVCADLPAAGRLEINLDDNPEAARRLSVLSLPTTLIIDADGQVRYRTSRVPTAADLRAALKPLLA
ncbi:MAG: thioredoxin family protein [Actinomycetia bacterium]|nr:thioredoxin family protein [Actinomycetes bacterium]MCH9700109.1 thioredoxin family protein [Actinomycetes bacterium]MCH9759457.1 thioredoxin family protein [Actinomycetes bacterium]